MPFPNIDPIAFSIGPLAIRWYALAYLVGIGFAFFYGRQLIKQKPIWHQSTPPMTATQLTDFVFWAIIGVILGGRIAYVLFYSILVGGDYYLQNPLSIFAVWEGGMSFHGGLIGVALAAVFFARHIKQNPLSALDLMAAIAPIGLLLGRIANFINGELYGRVTTMPWGVVFPDGGPNPRHPSQLYEGLLEGLLCFIILRIATHNLTALRKPGLVAGLFAVIYALSRILVEFVREPDAHIGLLPYGLTMGMALSIPVGLIGLALMINAGRTKKGGRAI
ncbi:prolipoprotein diacylglyceryl transferase [Maritalea sp. S77]|uniref:prolipoprotein diacylglyceryl transferase n=1 Tax=Maritalea sp. S77 TaxID=3415125 RepID=UPI003C79FD4C